MLNVSHFALLFRVSGLLPRQRLGPAPFEHGIVAGVELRSLPFQMQDIYSRHLGIDEHRVRVIAPDVGGGFGLKINTHGDEIAVAAISKLMGRPVDTKSLWGG